MARKENARGQPTIWPEYSDESWGGHLRHRHGLDLAREQIAATVGTSDVPGWASEVGLIETARLDSVDPQAWLAEVLGRIPDYRINRADELLPRNCAPGENREADALPRQGGKTRRLWPRPAMQAFLVAVRRMRLGAVVYPVSSIAALQAPRASYEATEVKP